MNFFFLSETSLTSKNMNLKKNRNSKSTLDPKLCQFLYFICDIIFEKFSELRQTFCIIPRYVEKQDSLMFISSQVFNQSLWKLVQIKSTCFKRLKLENLCKIFVKGVELGPLYGVIFHSSPKQFQSNISRRNNNINFYSSTHLHF